MTEEKIIEMARQAGFVDYELDDGTTNAFDKRYEAFAKLIAEKEYERGFIDGMQKQMQSSVDKAVNAMIRPTYYIPSKDQREWVGLTSEDMKDERTHNFDFISGARWAEEILKERNT
jgi:hypothetical protein